MGVGAHRDLPRVAGLKATLPPLFPPRPKVFCSPLCHLVYVVFRSPPVYSVSSPASSPRRDASSGRVRDGLITKNYPWKSVHSVHFLSGSRAGRKVSVYRSIFPLGVNVRAGEHQASAAHFRFTRSGSHPSAIVYWMRAYLAGYRFLVGPKYAIRPSPTF